MDSDLILLRVPSELKYLADERTERRSAPAIRGSEAWSPRYEELPGLAEVAAKRLTTLIRTESVLREEKVAYPTWLQGQAIPRLVVSLHCEGRDVFGVSRALAKLDLAVRRAGAMYQHLSRGRSLTRWPEPIRTHRAGLYLLDAGVGSFDALMTVWGVLVTAAASAPVSVASLIALAWDIGRGAIHVTKRWRGAVLQQEDEHRRFEPAQSWGIKHTKELVPVLEKVIENDRGFEFSLTDGDLQLKITVLPRE